MNQQTKSRIGWILIGAGFIGGFVFGTAAGDFLQAGAAYITKRR